MTERQAGISDHEAGLTAAIEPAPTGPARWREVWTTRPVFYSRPLWALVLALDALPWPWGEDALARLFAAMSVLRGSRRRPALAWAARQPGHHPWRLALAVAAFRGRWLARSALVGVRRPEDLARRVVVEGEAHLAPTGQGSILLGFHLGPPGVDVALRVLGHRLAWLGGQRSAPVFARESWRRLDGKDLNLSPLDYQRFWPPYLYRARRILLDGGSLCVLADAKGGRGLFQVPLPGATLTIRAGWHLLQQQTGARVVPVTTRLEGRVQVVTVHPPLPAREGRNPDLAQWQAMLTALVQDYVSRYPEQCPMLAFPFFGRPLGRPAPGPATAPGPRPSP